jgi:hypothetical protein
VDRSEDPRVTAINFRRSCTIVVVLFLLLSCQLALAAEPTPVPTTSIAPSHTGVFYGHILDIRPDLSAITVKPTDKNLKKRRHFYLDKKTLIKVDGKRSLATELYYGDQVAVRYFGKGDLLVADAVYVVFGEFEPKDYVLKKKVIVVKKQDAETEKKAKKEH